MHNKEQVNALLLLIQGAEHFQDKNSGTLTVVKLLESLPSDWTILRLLVEGKFMPKICDFLDRCTSNKVESSATRESLARMSDRLLKALVRVVSHPSGSPDCATILVYLQADAVF